MAQQPQLDK